MMGTTFVFTSVQRHKSHWKVNQTLPLYFENFLFLYIQSVEAT